MDAFNQEKVTKAAEQHAKAMERIADVLEMAWAVIKEAIDEDKKRFEKKG